MGHEMAQMFPPDFMFTSCPHYSLALFPSFIKQVHTINIKERSLLLLVSDQCDASQSAALLQYRLHVLSTALFMVATQFL